MCIRDRCRFIVFDFDNHEKGAEATDFANVDSEWHKEVDALRKMCELNGIRPLAVSYTHLCCKLRPKFYE